MEQMDNHVEGIMGLAHWETQDNPTPSKHALNDPNEVILAKEWNSLHHLGRS
jgi:hypothetical protein